MGPWLLQLFLAAWAIVSATALGAPPHCLQPDLPIVRNVGDMYEDSYGRPGLSHITIAGATHHGMKDVEVWLQTFAPGSETPIHRHSCEEVFVVLRGRGSLFMEPESGKRYPGDPKEFSISPNTTFTIPVNLVHQLKNTQMEEDLQVLVVISRPPVKVFAYKDWHTPHAAATLTFPYPWDALCMKDGKPTFEGDDVFDEL